MKCFKHPETDAIGICKSCNKGLCSECAHNSSAGLACIESCIDEVDALFQIVERSKELYSIGSKPPVFTSGMLVYFLFAALFGGWGAYSYIAHGEDFAFLILMAAGMLGIGVFSVYKQRQLRLNC